MSFYALLTWDTDLEEWTPQEGVRDRHLSLGELRRSLRLLRAAGYSARRGDPSVRIEEDWWPLVERRGRPT